MLDENGRRFMLNACLWSLGMDEMIKPDLSVKISNFQPTFYTTGVYVGKVKPSDLSGWDSEIMPTKNEIVGLESPKFLRRANLVLGNRPDDKARIEMQDPEILSKTKKK